MSFDTQTIKNISTLARIQLSPDKQEHLARDISDILAWVEQLQSVNVDGVEPLISVSPQGCGHRADTVTEGDIQSELMANAVDAAQGFYTVPKMVE